MYYRARSFIAELILDFRFSGSCRTLAALGSLIFLGACSSNYRVEQTFPRPLVDPVPVSVDLNLSEEFKNYVYEEKTEGRRKITVALGGAQTVLFETMSDHMFSGAGQTDPQLVVTPSIEAFQYAIPRETRAEIYEIWLKYRIMVSTKDGEPVADWLITGYGKTPTAFLKSQQQAIDSAAGIALRDIGSQLSIGFGRQPDIQAWLASFSREQGQ